MRLRIAPLRRGSPIALMAALALIVAACAGEEVTPTPQPPVETQPPAATQPPETQPPAVEKAKIVVSLSDTVSVIEPHTFRTTSAYWVTDALYDPLLSQIFEETEGQWLGSTTHEGRGAVSFEASDDLLTYTFTIRDGHKFANGEPVTAEDYKYVFQRSIESAADQGEGYIGLLLPFVGIDSADQLQVIDDKTFVITPSLASPLFERFMTFQVFGALDKDFLESVATEDDPWSFRAMDQAGAGSGPYTMTGEWDPDTQLELAPNPNYWNADAVANGGIIVRNVPNADSRAQLLLAGELDLATGLPPQLLTELEADPNVTVYAAPTSGVEYLGMNVNIPPFDNQDFRQAIAYAVPYQALLDQVMFGFASYAGTPVPTHMDTFAGKGPTLDLEKAQAFVDASGVDVSDLAITLTVRESRSTNQEAAVLIQDSLRQLGITMNIDIIPDADFATKQAAGELPMQIHDWYSWGEDPFYQMTFLTTCGSFANYALWCNDDYDALVQQGVRTADLAERDRISAEAQDIFLAEMPWATLWATDRTVAVRSCITGVERGYTNISSFWRLDKSGC
ncbi:MAG: ABC transporter substrate-binding protein [Acidimicrobiia bacterium]